jgi:ATP/maltotriose-dependent transcriptional regulator MalT
MATAALLGPTPALDGIARCERIRADAPGNRIVERAVLPALAGLSAMTGDIDGARQRLVEHGRLCDELGLRLDAAEGAIVAGLVELLASSPAGAEAALARAVADLQAMGERANLGMAAALLGEAQHQLGREADAIAATRVAEAAAAPDDLGTQVAWRIARAGALVASGDVIDGRRLADEAARLAGQTDSLELRGQAQAALAAADLVRGETALARSAFEKSVTAFDRKGDVVSAAAARRRLEALDELSAGAAT